MSLHAYYYQTCPSCRGDGWVPFSNEGGEPMLEPCQDCGTDGRKSLDLNVESGELRCEDRDGDVVILVGSDVSDFVADLFAAGLLSAQDTAAIIDTVRERVA